MYLFAWTQLRSYSPISVEPCLQISEHPACLQFLFVFSFHFCPYHAFDMFSKIGVVTLSRFLAQCWHELLSHLLLNKGALLGPFLALDVVCRPFAMPVPLL